MKWMLLGLLSALPTAALAATDMAAKTTDFAEAVATCTPGALDMPHPLIRGFTIAHRIEGERDGLCHYTQSMPGGMHMECAFTDAGREAYAAEFVKFAAGRMHGSTADKPAWADDCVIVTRDGKRLPMAGSS